MQSLQSSRGKKLRDAQNLFIAEGLQSVREALTSKLSYLEVQTLYLTENAQQKATQEFGQQVQELNATTGSSETPIGS